MVKQAKPGVLIDGKGLRLRVTVNPKTGDMRKSWLLRVTIKGGPVREIGLGSADDVSLKEARERAGAARKLARDGVDPIAARDAERGARAAEAARAMSFRQCANAYIEAHRVGWRNAKHAAQWQSTLEAYAYPHFGDLPVQAVDLNLVLKALEPIWKTKTETASRVRQRIESVIDWATARSLRQGENPARWRGHLDKLLPARGKVQTVRHHAALAYADLPAFMAELKAQNTTAAKALQLLILTATRTSEVVNARWSEIDLDSEVWRIPPERMKAGREHRVPLSKSAMAVLRQMAAAGDGEVVFPGVKPGKPLSNMAMMQLLERMGHGDLTVHGFRSTFRDWAAEQNNQPREVHEAALAHTISDKVEAAYRRTDLFDRRRRLMQDWARFCSTPAGDGKVIPIRRVKKR
jgi:integrase